MPGPPPKRPNLRQRKNRVATAALLQADENNDKKVPPLPPREKKTERWHPKALEWWKSTWHSPMASEFLDSDMRGGLLLIAELYHQRWTTDDAALLVNLSKEIRQQEVRFGLSPIDRRRLQWEIEKGEQAVDRTTSRRQAKVAGGKDPRDVLRLAK